MQSVINDPIYAVVWEQQTGECNCTWRYQGFLGHSDCNTLKDSQLQSVPEEYNKSVQESQMHILES